MNNSSPRHESARLSSYVRLLACCAALGLAPSAYAVCTGTPTVACLADQPIQSTSVVKPNVMFVLDNSGSMTWTYMPDKANNFLGKYGYHSNQCNGVYYDPATTYLPPKNSSNALLPDAIFTAARDSGFDGTSTARNLNSAFIANRFEPDAANSTYSGNGSYTGGTSLGPYGAFYYAYTGAVTAKDYENTGSAFYTECNTAIGSASAVFSKRRLATTETTTIIVSGSGSTSVSSIKVNGVELMSGSTSASGTTSTVASRIAAKITLNGFTATASSVSGVDFVTITGPTSAADYTPVIVKSGSMTLTTDVFPDTTPAKLTNFANWYSYYRTRMLMMKSGMSTAFATIDDKIRVGFHTINRPANGDSTGRSLNIDDFAATQKNNWYTALWSIAPNDSTPLQIALSRVGNYYAKSGTRTGLSTTIDPVQYSCQKNFAILSTDGFWNGGTATGTDGLNIGDVDKTVPASMPLKPATPPSMVPPPFSVTDTGLTPSENFPNPYYEGASASSATLADVAMYYWVKDLRTTGVLAPNNVPVTTSDPAYWQHMTTYTIGLGVNGTLSYPTDLAALTSGTKTWPVPIANNITAVDDLWHAAVNGRGQYFRATDPTTLANSLNAVLRAVSNAPNFGAGPASSTNDFKSPNQSDYTTYASSYRVDDWSGDVKKYALDRATGLTTGAALWSASKQLDSKVNPGLHSPVNATAYTTRNIVTRNEVSGNAVDFAYPAAVSSTTMSASQVTALCYKVSPGTGSCVGGDASLVNYLRGDATYEGVYGASLPVVGTSRFRDRHDPTEIADFRRNLIGSIINAQPAYVAVEQEIYQDAGYEAFKTASKTRAPTLYVGANDGMLHALNAATGDELWAYVPSFVIPTATDENGKEKGLRALSYQDSGAPAYAHHYYLDGPLEAGAVDFNRTGGPAPIDSTPAVLLAGVWKNILVGGLGKGGKGYYALDVTAPATSLADAKTKVLWEFPSATDTSHLPVITGGQMGYSFGRPIIAKTYTYGWVVMLPSGYNNSDGLGRVFVLNAKTGKLLETLTTPTAAPGMAHITMLAQAKNKYALQVYSGDLNGSVWRFDFGQTPLTPRVSQIFSSSTSTPIATEVNVSIDGNNGDRWIFFGTGQYLDVPDRAVTAGYQQYLVALRDGNVNLPRTVVSPAVLLPVALTALTPVTNLLTGVPSAPSGWSYALPTLHPLPTDPVIGERNALKPVADLRTVIFASLIPTTDPCSPGVTGYAYGLEYSTGKSRLISGTSLVPSVYLPHGISSIEIVMSGKGSTSSGKAKGKICSGDGTCVDVQMDPSGLFSGTRHVGWRELLNE